MDIWQTIPLRSGSTKAEVG